VKYFTVTYRKRKVLDEVGLNVKENVRFRMTEQTMDKLMFLRCVSKSGNDSWTERVDIARVDITGVDIAGVDFARVDIAGVDIDGGHRTGGHCRGGHCRGCQRSDNIL